MPAFDNEKYLAHQKESILKRLKASSNRLYIEFGGKLICDYHAARVLPGYDPNVKIRLLKELSDKADIIICIHAGVIEEHKIRGDLGITYDKEALRLIDDLRGRGVEVTAVVITRFSGEPSALQFKKSLEKSGVKVFVHKGIDGYPMDIDRVVSDTGFGSNPFIPVKQPLVVVTGPGPNSGKMGTCLSQIYHEFKHGDIAHYAKFETFPVWNLPLNHPVNLAYEAATADLRDMNAMDFFHFEAYGKMAVNYNRDLQAFPLLRTVLQRIAGSEAWYQSPTDMGVNCVADGIIDDAAVRKAAKDEISRRYFRIYADYKLGHADARTVGRIQEVAAKADINPDERDVVVAARQAAEDCRKEGKGNKGTYCGAAIRLENGKIVTGKNSPLMHSSAGMVINAAKELGGIEDSHHLLLPEILESVADFKDSLGSVRTPGLDVSETLIALVVSANTDPAAQKAVECLKMLRNCDMHLTHIPTSGDEAGLRRLGISYTYDPVPSTKNLFM